MMNASVATAKELSALEELVNMPQRGENPYIREWKGKGVKGFGFMCTYVPEEILYSENGRILPIRVGAAAGGINEALVIQTAIDWCSSTGSALVATVLLKTLINAVAASAITTTVTIISNRVNPDEFEEILIKGYFPADSVYGYGICKIPKA